MDNQIMCKMHDQQERITHVGVLGRPLLSVQQVIMEINDGHTFHTFENNHRARVHAAIRNGRAYITTHPDGVTENNLDELKMCVR